MLLKSIDAIQASDIADLVANRTREVRSLDYKQKLPDGTDGATKEFLGDVASFANAGGGMIVWGVKDVRDAKNKQTGIPEIVGLPGENLDQAVLRFDQLVRSGIEPLIAGVRSRVLDFDDGKSVIVTVVPRSWNAPHMVKHQHTQRFFSRGSAGRLQLDVSEIRAAFLANETQSTRVGRFRDERIGRLSAGETPAPLMYDAQMILHVYPYAALDTAFAVDLQAKSTLATSLPPMGSSGWDSRYNFDGFMTHAGSNELVRAYVQLFRNGAIESVNSSIMGEERALFVGGIEKAFIEALTYVAKFYKNLGIEGPVAIMLALNNVRGCRVAAPSEAPPFSWTRQPARSCGRSVQSWPESVGPSHLNSRRRQFVSAALAIGLSARSHVISI